MRIPNLVTGVKACDRQALQILREATEKARKE